MKRLLVYKEGGCGDFMIASFFENETDLGTPYTSYTRENQV